MEKKHIFILLAILILIWVVNDLRQGSQGEFEKAYEYFFKDKSYMEIENYLNRENEHYMRARTDREQMYALVNMMEGRHFLLYENRYSLSPELRFQLKNKKNYTEEIGKFLRRKRKIKIKYLKYEVSVPVVSKDGTIEMAEVFLIRTSKGEKEYIKYDFKKYSNGRYYLYLDNAILPNQLKFKFKEKQGD